RIQLPSASALVPVWRRAATGDRVARAELAWMIPRDYTVTDEGCLRSTRWSTGAAERLWLPSVGEPVPPMWEALIARVLGHRIYGDIWHPAGALVTVD